jgi:hypothetical protein
MSKMKPENYQSEDLQQNSENLVPQESGLMMAEMSYKSGEQRKYPIKDWEIVEKEDLEGEYAEILPAVAESLSKIDSSDALIEHLQKVDELISSGSWNGLKVKKKDEEDEIYGVYYNDSPLESVEYRILMNETYLPALAKLESLASSSDVQKRSETVEKLVEYVVNNYEYSSWYFNRASEVAVTMLNLDGTNAFSAIKRISERITDEKSISYVSDISEEDGLEFNPNDYLTPSYLEFDESDHREFHWAVVRAVADHPWKEDEKKEAIKFLSDYISINSAGNLDIYVQAFEKLDAGEAVPYLLKNLKSDDVLTRRMSAEVLFRLELGKMGVTEKGVEYLGKLYDLGKYNNPDFFVRRLDNSGLMAILGENDGGIKSVFPLDLYAEEDVIRADVRQLISQELFLPMADETPQQRAERDEYLKLFLENYEGIFNDKFFGGTGLRLNSLNLHEQGWFLLYYLELSEKGDQKAIERLKNFVCEYGEYGLKSFLVLNYGGSGQDILDFSENESLTKKEKLAVFKNFYGIANEAMNWRHIFEKVEENVNYKFSIEAYESLIRKNSEFFKAAQIMAGERENFNGNISELLSAMNSVLESLRALQVFYNRNIGFKITRTSVHDEYGENGELINGVRHSWVFKSAEGDRIDVTVRTKKTINSNGIMGGEPRINFKITNHRDNTVTRIGFDLSYYRKLVGESDVPSVSLDLGVLNPKFDEVRYSTESIGRILSLVAGSEGGHNESSFKPDAYKYFENIANSFIDYIDRTFST